MLSVIFLNSQLKEVSWQIEVESLQLEKVQAPFTDPVPPGFEREAAVREGYRVKCLLHTLKPPKETHELTCIYLSQQQRIFNLLIPPRHRVEDLSALIQLIQQRLAEEKS